MNKTIVDKIISTSSYMNINNSNSSKVVTYIVIFKNDPYDKNSNVPVWWPKYILEKASDHLFWNPYDGYAVIVKMAEQYCQDFNKYLDGIKPYVKSYTKHAE